MNDEAEEARRRTSERIAEVRARFAAGLTERVNALSALAMTAGGADRAAAAEAFGGLRLGLHNLAGGAPTLGLPALGRAAATLEKRLIAARCPDGGLDAETAAALARDVAVLPSTIG